MMRAVFMFCLAMGLTLGFATDVMAQRRKEDLPKIDPPASVACSARFCDRDKAHLETFLVGFYKWYVRRTMETEMPEWYKEHKIPKGLLGGQQLDYRLIQVYAYGMQTGLALKPFLTNTFFQAIFYDRYVQHDHPQTSGCEQDDPIYCHIDYFPEWLDYLYARITNLQGLQVEALVSLTKYETTLPFDNKFHLVLLVKLSAENGFWKISEIKRY